MAAAGLTWVDRLDEPAQVEQLLTLFDREWWTQGRDRAGVERMLAGSAEIVAALDGDELVAFGRAITDGVYLGTLDDIVVASGWRDRGLGTAVVNELLRRPSVAATERVSLHCLPELIPYYERLGFSPSDRTLRRMEIVAPGAPAYTRPTRWPT